LKASDSTISSFILKIWVEDSLDSLAERGWHGYVTHVSSGIRMYANRPDDILAFIQRTVGEDVFRVIPPQDKQDHEEL